MKVGNLQFPRNAADKPLALSPDGKFLSAKDIVTREFGRGSLGSLDAGQQKKLTLKRYEMEPDFKLGIFGVGLLTKAEVIQEIKEETDFGQLVVQVEMGYCTELLSSLTGKAEKVASMPTVPPVKRVPTLPPYKPVTPAKKCILIPMKTRAVFCENTTDSITKDFAAYRIAKVHPAFASRGFTVIPLTGVNDDRAHFVPQALSSLTVYLGGIGHGNATTYTGHSNSPILQVGHYAAAEVAGKAIHFLSCQTAIALGPDTVAKGALCYAGYNANFTFVGDTPGTPVNEKELFMIADSRFDIWMACGLTADQARTATIAAFNAGIAMVPGTVAASWLTYDRDHFKLLGNVATKILPVRMVKVCFPLMSLESENALVSLGELVD
ncbi:MAG: hypothetical protein NTX53_18900 [candidate division WOR-3 bacterium]|nr:hypothetical protein [candidate division WOR-3 bacterium]